MESRADLLSSGAPADFVNFELRTVPELNGEVPWTGQVITYDP